ncbi:MAG: putative sulfate exporter family transporter [Ignavibacteriae bacterium]|nr:putative sulfate exporter family transporter [Ignavibacteriota bacterium]
MAWVKQLGSGILLSLGIALVAAYAGSMFPLIGGAVFGILIGIAAGSVIRIRGGIMPGVQFTSKKVLQWAVMLLGSGLGLGQVYATGAASLIIILVTISSALLVAVAAGRALGVHFNLKSLIGVGTAICGGSAIAAIAPVIEAEDQEVSYAFSTVFLFNVIAVFIFPPLGHLLGMSQEGFGLFAGTAINDTSSVVAAGYTYGNAAGDHATVVKLTRTLMIIPIALAFVAVMVRRKRAAHTHADPHVRIGGIFPWFILGFLAMSALNTSGILGDPAIAFLTGAGKFLIVMALSAIGLKTDLRTMLASGTRPLILGLIVWVTVALTSIAVQWFGGQW